MDKSLTILNFHHLSLSFQVLFEPISDCCFVLLCFRIPTKTYNFDRYILQEKPPAGALVPMGAIYGMTLVPRASNATKASMSQSDQILEAWGEGFNLGALVILILLVFCNYRVKILLHKLILLEVRSPDCERQCH